MDLIYGCWFMLGLAMLFPFNAMIKGKAYYSSRLVGSIYGSSFDNFVVAIYTLSNLFFLLMVNILQHNHESIRKKLSENKENRKIITIYYYFLKFAYGFNNIKKEKKILFAFLIELCIMFIMTILPLLKSAAAPVFFYLVLFSSLLLGIMTAILQDGLFGIVSHFPFMYTQSLMAGQGLAGLSSSISNILSTTIRLNGTMEDSESIGVVVYFAISLLIIIAALGCFVVVWKSSMYQTLLHGKISEICDDSGRVCDEDNESNNSLATVNKTSPGANSELEIISPLYLSSTSHSVFHHIKYHAIAVFWIFMVTLSVFPGLIASTVSSRAETEQGSFEKNYFIAFSFLLFDIGDVIGKVLPGFHFFLITNPIWNRLGAVFRTIFIPLLMSANLVFINTKMEKIPIYWTSFVQNDATFYLILLAFAISNGYFGSTLMMTGPGLVPDISKRGLAGSLMALWLTAGLAVGSVLAFAVKAILIHDNPFVL